MCLTKNDISQPPLQIRMVTNVQVSYWVQFRESSLQRAYLAGRHPIAFSSIASILPRLWCDGREFQQPFCDPEATSRVGVTFGLCIICRAS